MRFDVHAAESDRRVSRAFVKEVTLCLATEPSEPLAWLLSIRPTETKPTAREEIEPTVISRPGIGQVLVR